MIIVFFFFSTPAFALDTSIEEGDSFFRAEVLEVLEERKVEFSEGEERLQQNLKLLGLEGDYAGEEVVFEGIADFELLDDRVYGVGDKVLVVATRDAQGGEHFYITDYVRTNYLWLLGGIFVLVILFTAKWKGLRSLISLGISLAIVVGFIVPKIVSGSNPVIVTLLGSFAALLIIVYVTEGWKPRSHLAVSSIFLSLLLTLFLSWSFIKLAYLTGITGEETDLILGGLATDMNFQGLLLAGIVIGSLGFLGDMVISQVATTEEIHSTNNYLTKSKLFKKAYRVGASHISSMVNTLFLAYAGASLPLLIIFSNPQSPFGSWIHIINTEAIATEIVRTLCGSIGLVLAVPLATGLAVWYYKR